MRSRGSRPVRVLALLAAVAAFASAARSGASAQGVPEVVNPPAGYPYPNVAGSTVPAPGPSDPGPSPAASAAAPAATDQDQEGPSVDPTSEAPNTRGNGVSVPPVLRIAPDYRDTSPTFRIGGSALPHGTTVSRRALAVYRHDPVYALARGGASVTYAGVALQFLPGVGSLVHPSTAGSGPLVALSRATIVVTGRDGVHASFPSSALIDANGDPRVFLADRRNGVTIGAPEGPFRLVVPGDKNRSKWIRDVVEIDVDR